MSIVYETTLRVLDGYEERVDGDRLWPAARIGFATGPNAGDASGGYIFHRVLAGGLANRFRFRFEEIEVSTNDKTTDECYIRIPLEQWMRAALGFQVYEYQFINAPVVGSAPWNAAGSSDYLKYTFGRRTRKTGGQGNVGANVLPESYCDVPTNLAFQAEIALPNENLAPTFSWGWAWAWDRAKLARGMRAYTPPY